MDDQTDRRSYGALRNEEIISALHSSQDFFGLFDTHNEMLTTVKLTNTSSHRGQVVPTFCGTFLLFKKKIWCGSEGDTEMQSTDGEEL